MLPGACARWRWCCCGDIKSAEIDRIEKQRRKAAFARHVGDEAAKEREDHRRAGDEKEWLERAFRHALDLQQAGIDGLEHVDGAELFVAVALNSIAVSYRSSSTRWRADVDLDLQARLIAGAGDQLMNVRILERQILDVLVDDLGLDRDSGRRGAWLRQRRFHCVPCRPSCPSRAFAIREFRRGSLARHFRMRNRTRLLDQCVCDQERERRGWTALPEARIGLSLTRSYSPSMTMPSSWTGVSLVGRAEGFAADLGLIVEQRYQFQQTGADDEVANLRNEQEEAHNVGRSRRGKSEAGPRGPGESHRRAAESLRVPFPVAIARAQKRTGRRGGSRRFRGSRSEDDGCEPPNADHLPETDQQPDFQQWQGRERHDQGDFQRLRHKLSQNCRGTLARMHGLSHSPSGKTSRRSTVSTSVSRRSDACHDGDIGRQTRATLRCYRSFHLQIARSQPLDTVIRWRAYPCEAHLGTHFPHRRRRPLE